MNTAFEYAFEFVFMVFLLNCVINLLFGIDIVSTIVHFVQMKIAKCKTTQEDDQD